MSVNEGAEAIRPEEYRSAWRVEIAVAIRGLRHRLQVADHHPQLSAGGIYAQVPMTSIGGAQECLADLHSRAVKEALCDAQRAIDTNGRRGLDNAVRSIPAWWTGTMVTAAWESLHDAEAKLVMLEGEADVRASLPGLVGWLEEVIPGRDEKAKYKRLLTELMDEHASSDPVNRPLVKEAYKQAIGASNDVHENLRVFRNLLTLVTAGLAALLLALAVWHAVSVKFISLCSAELSPSISGGQRCLTGSSPAPRDVAEIELVGALGGLVSIAFGLGKEKFPPPRYNPRPAQAALKPVAGAATGLLAVILFQSKLIAPTTNTSESLLLGYAAAFGSRSSYSPI